MSYQPVREVLLEQQREKENTDRAALLTGFDQAWPPPVTDDTP